jgi:predicted DNA-binding WGR domain protein
MADLFDKRMTTLHLRRVDPARNMRRFYRLDVQPDLFGGVLLVKEWGRIGAQGRTVAERYDDEALAADALQRQAERKKRKGYVTQEA